MRKLIVVAAVAFLVVVSSALAETFKGNDGVNVMWGTDNGDLFYLYGGNDYANGRKSGDGFSGGGGSDVLEGVSGNDYIEGNGGVDDLRGGEDNDTLVGAGDGGDSDKLIGGAGYDVCYKGQWDIVQSGCESVR